MKGQKIIGIVCLVGCVMGLTFLLVAYGISSFITEQMSNQAALESGQQNVNMNSDIDFAGKIQNKELVAQASNTITAGISYLVLIDLIPGIIGVYLLVKKNNKV